MNGTIRKLPIGIQSFRSMREDGYLYVDKTTYIEQLVSTGKQYFLSRPRRFGKSLLLSTLRAYWEGQKELFHGLAIEIEEEKREKPWQKYPVFYFDFNRDSFQKTDSLETILDAHLASWEKSYGYRPEAKSLALRFQDLLMHVYHQTGLRCVVLVDEYDKPLLEVVEHQEAEEHNKAVFKGFFSTLKSFDDYLQFVMITGVTKFSKVSIFSDLNQLRDISMTEDYAGICGITMEELSAVFGPEIHRMAESAQIDDAACIEQLKRTYDGYHFYPGNGGVFNPFSLLNALADRNLSSYWFESGTPTFLVKKLRQLDFDARKLSDHTLYANERMLSDYRIDNPDPIPLLYQTGYLTIANYDKRRNRYTLAFPNEEVKYAFLESLMPEYVGNTGAGSGKDIYTLTDYLEEGDVDGIHNVFVALFAGIPYAQASDPFEHDFQTVLYLVFTLLGKYVRCEMHTSQGRADCVVETKDYIYLFEFKRDKSADEALQQIEEKGYALPYAADQRTLYKIGVNFDSATRMPTEWKVVS